MVDCILVACLSCWVEPGDEFANEEPVECAFEDPVNSDNCAGKMIIPSKSLLSLFASCSLFCYAAIPTACYIMPPILPWEASNPPCPSKPLFGYVTALLSPSYSVVSCRWRLEFVPCWNMDILLGYHNISYLINASIYLVKGGRLGLMPGVFVPLLPP